MQVRRVIRSENSIAGRAKCCLITRTPAMQRANRKQSSSAKTKISRSRWCIFLVLFLRRTDFSTMLQFYHVSLNLPHNHRDSLPFPCRNTGWTSCCSLCALYSCTKMLLHARIAFLFIVSYYWSTWTEVKLMNMSRFFCNLEGTLMRKLWVYTFLTENVHPSMFAS